MKYQIEMVEGGFIITEIIGKERTKHVVATDSWESPVESDEDQFNMLCLFNRLSYIMDPNHNNKHKATRLNIEIVKND